MDLEKLLGKELYDQVMAKLGTEFQLYPHKKDQKVVIDDGVNYIPKHRFDEVNNQNKSLKEQIEKLEKDFKDLEKAAKGNDELKTQLEAMKAERKAEKEAYDKKTAEDKKSFALKEALFNAGVVDETARDLLLKSFSLDKVELDAEGKVKDFDTHVKPLKDNKAFTTLFNKPVVKGTGHDTTQETDPTLLTRDQVKNASQEFVNANEDLVKRSVAAFSKQNS